jgi:hypothetical protein
LAQELPPLVNLRLPQLSHSWPDLHLEKTLDMPHYTNLVDVSILLHHSVNPANHTLINDGCVLTLHEILYTLWSFCSDCNCQHLMLHRSDLLQLSKLLLINNQIQLETNGHIATIDSAGHLWNQNVHYRIHNSLPMLPEPNKYSTQPPSL